MEGLLIQLLIWIIIVAVIFAVIRLVLPNLGFPPWAAQAIMIVVSAIVLIWLIYILLPLAHRALP